MGNRREETGGGGGMRRMRRKEDKVGHDCASRFFFAGMYVVVVCIFKLFLLWRAPGMRVHSNFIIRFRYMFCMPNLCS